MGWCRVCLYDWCIVIVQCIISILVFIIFIFSAIVLTIVFFFIRHPLLFTQHSFTEFTQYIVQITLNPMFWHKIQQLKTNFELRIHDVYLFLQDV